MKIVQWIPRAMRALNNGWPRWMGCTIEPRCSGTFVTGRGGRRRRARRRSADRAIELEVKDLRRGALPRHALREVRAWVARGAVG